MSFEQLVRPTFAEARSTSLQEGFLFGLIPGVVTRVDDPEQIGRVQVECPVIEPGANLPNSNDGWIHVMEPFVVNGTTGGSHSFVQVGSQVVMACLFGDPRQMIVLGCLPSRVDRPHPDLNRATGTYGSATPNETIEAFRDTDASAVISRPNGVVQTISGEGDVTIQTEERGRITILRDGTTSLSNDFSHTTLSKDGEVSQRSAEGAIAILRANGKVEIASASAARLQLDQQDGLLEGPLSALSQAVDGVGSLSSALGEAQGFLTDLKAIAQDFPSGGDLERFLSQAGSVLEDLKELNNSLATGAGWLQQIQDTSLEELGRSLLPQVSSLRKLGNLARQIEPLLNRSSSGAAIAQQVAALLPEDLAKNFSAQQIGTILDGLQHDQSMQLQAILGAIAPGGFHSIRNLIGLDLHRDLNDIEQVIQAFQALPPPLPNAPTPPEDPLKLAIAALRSRLPRTIAQFFDEEAIASVLQRPTLEDAVQTLLGTSLSGITAQAAGAVAQIQGGAGNLEPLSRLINGLADGKPASDALESLRSAGLLPSAQSPSEQDLRAALLGEVDRLSPAIASGLSAVNQLLNAVPAGESGAKLRATQTTAQMETYLGAAGAIAKVTPATASLIAPGGSSEIFAGITGVGMKSPLGSLSFGAGGGSLLSTAGLVLQSFRNGGAAAGLRINPEGGVTLSSYATAPRWDENENIWQNDTARVAVVGNVVTIESRAGQSATHQILVTPEGIFLDGIDIAILPSLINEVQRLAARVAALEGAATPPLTP